MTDVDTVRLIIADPRQYDRALAVGDGVSTQFPMPNAPVVGSTVLAWVAATPVVPAVIDESLGMVTFTIPPADGAEVIVTYQWSVMLDVDLQAFLDLEGGVIKLAAAQAIDTIASSEAMVQKRITLLDLQTDGPATSRALREHAKALRRQAEDELIVADQDGMIDIAEMVLPPFTGYSHEKWRKEHEEWDW